MLSMYNFALLKALSLGQHKYAQAQQYLQPENGLNPATIHKRFRQSLMDILRRHGRRPLMPNFFKKILAHTTVSDDFNTCGKPEGCLRIASLNVHLWEDGEYMDNVDRVAKLVNDHEVDILCLQEAPAGDNLNRFMKLTKERFGPFDDDSAGDLPTPIVGTDKKGRYSVVVLSRYQNYEYKFT